MYKLMDVGKSANTLYKFYKCDTEADMNTIDKVEAGFGAEAYIIHGSKLYMLDGSGVWVAQ